MTQDDSLPRDLLPVDTDVEEPGSRASLGPPRLGMVAVVFAGGMLGGLARYEIVKAWSPTGAGFPWSTFAVNTAGVFVLALLVVVVTDVLAPTTYLRPLIGTGFCGALTTFSAVAVQFDELAAHGHAVTAIVYLLSSLGAGATVALAAVSAGRRIPPTAGRVAAASRPS